MASSGSPTKRARVVLHDNLSEDPTVIVVKDTPPELAAALVQVALDAERNFGIVTHVDWLKKGIEHQEKAEYDAAVKCFDEVLRRNPDDVGALRALGFMFQHGCGVKISDDSAQRLVCRAEALGMRDVPSTSTDWMLKQFEAMEAKEGCGASSHGSGALGTGLG